METTRTERAQRTLTAAAAALLLIDLIRYEWRTWHPKAPR